MIYRLLLNTKCIDLRLPNVLMVLTLVTLITFVTALLVGDYSLTVLDVFKSLVGWTTADFESLFVIRTLRLPRVLIAWLVGVGLAVSGAILQGLTRNVLADPGIIGVNAGAALGAVSIIVLFPTVPFELLPIVAFGGGLTIALLIYLLAGGKNSSPLRLVLCGVALAAVTNALTTLMLTFGKINNVTVALVWLAGSVSGKSWEQFWLLLIWMLVLVPLLLLMARELNVLQFGDEVARGLGCAVIRQRTCLLLISVTLASVCVATAGAMSFVGLIAPHFARRLVGSFSNRLILVTALIGGLLVMLADLLGRTLFAPIELPCGLMTTVIGTPYFIYMLLQSHWKQK